MEGGKQAAGRRVVLMAAALLAGGVAGGLVRGVAARDGGAQNGSGNGRADPSTAAPAGIGTDAVPPDAALAGRATLGFSQQQWSKLVRNPQAFAIPLTEILPLANPEEAIPTLNDIPLIGRLFQTRIPDGLRACADLLGWEESRTKAVAAALARYGKQLANEEAKGVSHRYLPGGGIHFDFSASREAREALAEALRAECGELVGSRDFERFSLLSGLAGLAGPTDDFYQITASTNNGFVVVEAPRVRELIAPVGTAFEAHVLQEIGIDRRIQHLGVEIDWAKLVPDLYPPPSR